jgi:hypothetical protein
VLLYERFTGPAITTRRQEDLRRARRRRTGAPGDQEESRRRQRPDRRAGFAGGGPVRERAVPSAALQTFEDKKRSTIDAMAYSAAVGLTAHLDEVLFPTRAAAPDQILSNLDQYRMYDRGSRCIARARRSSGCR